MSHQVDTLDSVLDNAHGPQDSSTSGAEADPLVAPFVIH
jgi:hypothetical protein